MNERQYVGEVGGMRALVAAMVLGLVQDLALLRRKGYWRERVAELEGQDASGRSTAVAAVWVPGMGSRVYLEAVCRVAGELMEMRLHPEAIEAAAKCKRIPYPRYLGKGGAKIESEKK